MITKNIFKGVLAIFLLVAVLPNFAYAWDNNFYFTVPPNGERCFNFDIPRDFTTYADDRYQINITSDLGTNIHFIETDASSKIRIDVPICFSGKNRNESDFGYYQFKFKATGREKTFNGGVCVSSLDDVDIINKKGEPCDLINSHNKLFSGSLSPETLYLSEGESRNITLKLISQEDIDIEAKPETSLNIDKTPQIIRLERGKVKFVSFPISSSQKGEYNFSVLLDAIINRDYCEFPFCQSQVDNRVVVDGITKTGWEFEVFPRTTSTTRLEPTEFAATITNYDDDKSFTVNVDPEKGLKTDFQETTFNLKKGESRNLIVKITPETLDNKMYSIKFLVQSDKQESETSFLTVNEYTTDVCRRFPKLCEGSKPPNLGGCKVEGTNIINTSCLFGTQPNGGKPVNGGSGDNTIEPQREGLNPLFIIIPILIVFLVLVYFVFRKKKESEIEIE